MTKRKSSTGGKDHKKSKSQKKVADGAPEGEAIIPESRAAIEQFKLWLPRAQF